MRRAHRSRYDLEDERTRPVRPQPHGPAQDIAGRIVALQQSAGNEATTTALNRHQVQRQGSGGTVTVVQRVTLGVDYEVSNHGWQRINQRGISQVQLERTLDNPTVVHDDGSKWIYVSAWGGGNVCCRAVMSKDHPMVVITAYKVTGKKKVARYLARP